MTLSMLLKVGLGSIVLIAIIFFALVSLSKGRSYSDDDEPEFTKPTEFWTSDVIDDDIDDKYRENDWSSTDYNINDFDNKNY